MQQLAEIFVCWEAFLSINTPDAGSEVFDRMLSPLAGIKGL